jgi:L-lactate dehydrogenase (cytochrome)
LRAAGKDASHIFNPIHPPGTIEDGLVDYPDALKGNIDPKTVKHVELPKENVGEQKKELLALGQVIGLPDFAVSLVLNALADMPGRSTAAVDAQGMGLL